MLRREGAETNLSRIKAPLDSTGERVSHSVSAKASGSMLAADTTYPSTIRRATRWIFSVSRQDFPTWSDRDGTHGGIGRVRVRNLRTTLRFKPSHVVRGRESDRRVASKRAPRPHDHPGLWGNYPGRPGSEPHARGVGHRSYGLIRRGTSGASVPGTCLPSVPGHGVYRC